jgi:cytochrome P450
VTSDATGAPEEFDVFAAKNRMYGVGVVRDPLPRMHELRAECPLHQGSISGLFGTVGPDNSFVSDDAQMTLFGFDPIEATFRDPETWSNSNVAVTMGAVIGRTILQMDPPEHPRYRLLIQGAFTKKEMVRWEDEFVRDIVRAAVDRIAPLGRGDLSADFAFHYPITVIARACGLPIDDIDAFYEQATLLTNLLAPADVRLRAAAELGAIVQGLIDERRARPANDLISVLCAAEFKHPDDPSHHRLTDDEIVAFVRLLVPAGAQTTYRSLTNLLFALLTHPDQLEAVRADRSLLPQAIEEGLRWEPPLLTLPRVATHDTELVGTPIPQDMIVNLCLHSGNHDPARWDDPDAFDIFRPPQGHLSFGTGPHICLGIHFARMELRVALEELLDGLPNLRLDPAADDVHIAGLTARTAVSLPCLWDATDVG